MKRHVKKLEEAQFFPFPSRSWQVMQYNPVAGRKRIVETSDQYVGDQDWTHELPSCTKKLLEQKKHRRREQQKSNAGAIEVAVAVSLELRSGNNSYTSHESPQSRPMNKFNMHENETTAINATQLVRVKTKQFVTCSRLISDGRRRMIGNKQTNPCKQTRSKTLRNCLGDRSMGGPNNNSCYRNTEKIQSSNKNCIHTRIAGAYN
jgi:hypothetical protein